MTEDPVCLAAITAIARRSGLNEAVGVLYRAPGEAELVVELTNRSSEPQNSYIVSTADVVEALTLASGRSADDIDEADFVVWHSHPSGARGPSLKDMRSKLSGLRYAVVTLDDDYVDITEY